MGFARDYDFQFGNDTRFVTIAVKNNAFHTITIEADIAKTIDFSGGLRNVEVVRLSKCFKLTRVVWPEYTAGIKRLYISNSDALTKLDLSSLINLEELSILNCTSLTEISGIPSSLKELNAHHIKIRALDLSPATGLQKLNLVTDTSDLDLDLTHNQQLQILHVKTNRKCSDEKSGLMVTANNCNKLHTMFIDTGDNPLSLDVSGCTGITDFAITCGKDSHAKGLHDCKNLELYQVSSKLTLDDPTTIFINKIKKIQAATRDQKNQEKKLDAIKKYNCEFYAPAQAADVSIYDRETIINESGARQELGLPRAVKIMLLSMPIDFHEASSKKSLDTELIKPRYNEAAFTNTLHTNIFYLPETPFIPNPGTDLMNARVVSDRDSIKKTAVAFLKNLEGFTPNSFVINSKYLRDFMGFLQQFSPHIKSAVYANKKYPVRPQYRIVIYGDWYEAKNSIPTLVSNINIIPPAALVPPSINSLALSAEEQQHYQHKLLESNQLRNRERSYKEAHTMAQNLEQVSTSFFSAIDNVVANNLPQRMMSSEQPAQPGQSVVSDNDWIPQHDVEGSRSDRPLDPQHPVEGGTNNQPSNPPAIDPQHHVEGDAHNQPSKPPSIDPQHHVEGGTRNKPFDPQHLIDANNEKRSTNFEATPPLHAEGIDQLLLNKYGKKSDSLLKAKPLQVDSTDDQILLQTNTSKKETSQQQPRYPDNTNQQSLFGASRKRREDLPEQVLIEEAEASSLQPSETRLLEAAKDLANNMMKMVSNLDTASAINIKTICMDLKKVNKLESLISAASQLINAIKELHDDLKHEQSLASRNKSKASARPSDGDLMRTDLLNHLRVAHKNYTRPDIMHQTAYNLGVATARAKILNHLIDALTNHRKLDAHNVTLAMIELMKDPAIAAQLRDYEPLLIRFLTEMPTATKNNKLTDD